MKIAALVPYKVYPAKMGGQKGIALFYKYLSKRTPITFFTTQSNPTPPDHDIHCVHVMGNNKFRYINPLLFFRLRNWIKKTGISHLILEHPYFGWLGYLLGRFTDVRIVVHSHNIEAERFRSTGKWWWRILWNYEKSTHRMADENFFISPEDRNAAIENFGISPVKCHTITYGIEYEKIPSAESRKIARQKLMSTYPISPGQKILLFNGTLDYLPNRDALDKILEEINPRLRESGYEYKILICGKGLPAQYRDLAAYRDQNILYAGFVDDIETVFLGSDIFINPVIQGGGIKTKLVEALAYNMHAVSSRTGAIGVPLQITGQKMIVIDDGDWDHFSNAIISCGENHDIPDSYFSHFYWGNIADKALSVLNQLDHNTL